MKEISLKELKIKQLDILSYVSQFCKEHEINYWLDCGTLIGAIRHQGYIPWDDDIDVGMLRSDYEKFFRIFNSMSVAKYKLNSSGEGNVHIYAYGKVYDTSTIIYEPDENGIKSAVNIDIFVYDNAPDSKILTTLHYLKRDYFTGLLGLRMMNYTPHGGMIRRGLIKLGRILTAPIVQRKPIEYYVEKISHNAQHYNNINTKYLGNFTAKAKIHCRKYVFDSFIEVEFEGQRYNAPAKYDEWLKAFYGDYMRLPPVEKRVSHHRFVAYKKE
jgi:lipopolysaccharide cholinephosphotransferase